MGWTGGKPTRPLRPTLSPRRKASPRGVAAALVLALAVFLASAAAGEAARGPSMDSIPDFYHSTAKILEEFQRLAGGDGDGGGKGGGCGGRLRLKIIGNEGGVPLTEAVFSPLEGGQARHKALLIFGEHARELVSPETALRMARLMCGEHPDESKLPEGAMPRDRVDELVRSALRHTEVHMVPVVNPKGRESVEGGAFCQRVNENGVDLNRNWGDHWKSADEELEVPERGSDTFPGDAAFSEPETQTLKALMDELRPHIFITVHSGTLGMYMPYAYSTELPNDHPGDLHNMEAIIDELNPKYCRCPSGPAGKQVGYLCPGTCLDYAYDEVHTPYSFAFEIWADDADSIHEQFASKPDATLLELSAIRSASGHAHAHAHDHDHDHNHSRGPEPPRYSCFLQASQASAMAISSSLERDECIAFFNPPDEASYEATVQLWSEAFLHIIDLAAAQRERERGGKQSPQPESIVSQSISSGLASSTSGARGASSPMATTTTTSTTRTSIGQTSSLLKFQSQSPEPGRVAAPAVAAMHNLLRLKQLRSPSGHQQVQAPSRLRGTLSTVAASQAQTQTLVEEQMHQTPGIPIDERYRSYGATPNSAAGSMFEGIASVNGERAGAMPFVPGDGMTAGRPVFSIGDVGRMDSLREADIEAQSGEYSMPSQSSR